MKTTVKRQQTIVAQSVAAIGSAGDNKAQGSALAAVIIQSAYDAAKAVDAKRLTRRNWVKTMSAFDREAHLAFREALKAERTKVRADMDKLGYDANAHRVHGTSAASFFVDVSNYMGISAALEVDSSFVFVREGEHAGEVMAWEDILRHSRIIRKSKADGGAGAPTARKMRHAKLETVLKIAAKLAKDDMAKLADWALKAAK